MAEKLEQVKTLMKEWLDLYFKADDKDVDIDDLQGKLAEGAGIQLLICACDEVTPHEC